ncbi:aminotransferase class I/II-fold pyridoxal phosphate-dependent enzyme [Nonomuraea sp. NPDC001699]
MSDAFSKCQPRPDVRFALDSGFFPYYHPISERLADGEAVMDGKPVLMAGSNDYLALSNDPRLKAAAVAATTRLGAGNSGSRPSNGTLALHEDLEADLADFLHQEAALVVTTGYQANLALSALLAADDILFADKHVHASLLDAARLGQAELRRFRHNDVAQLNDQLETADQDRGRLIMTEGMFSTDGDLGDLPSLARIADRHGARLIVDGAHDVGLLGASGKGAAEHLGVLDAVDVQTLTFSKCFGTLGGAVAGPRHVIDHLRLHARAAVFSASLPPACTAAAHAALGIIRTESERRLAVLASARRLRADLTDLGFDTGPGSTPTIPVHVGDPLLCLRLWKELLNEGVFTNAMIPPAVPNGRALIRISVTAAHSDLQLDRITDACQAAGRRLELIPAQRPPTTPASAPE